MGLGLLILVSVGKENIYLSAQPEITFFKIAYKRYTNFSTEPIPQYFKTTPDFGTKCTINLAKNADLLSSMFLYVELPNIQMENFTNNTKNISNFAWVNKIGLALINYIEVEIGGYVIDRHYGDWINIWNEITRNKSTLRSYNKMIGNTPELTNYSQTKNSTILYIPLSFWFCLDTGLALPLIALVHNDIRINVQFNDIDTCYNVSPSHYLSVTNNICIYTEGEYFYQNYQNNKIIGKFIYFDPINQYLYYNPIKGTFVVPPLNNSSSAYNLIGNNSQYIMNIKSGTVIVQNDDYFKFNKPSLITSYMLVDYIYLDNFERAKFLNNSHEYLIPIVQTVSDQIIYSMNFGYKLPLINPVKILVWRGLLLSNNNNNDHFNYTSIPYTDKKEDLIIKNLLVINSINRMDLDSIEYYTYIPRYQYSLGNENGIYMYSFSLNPKEIQPSGSINFSKIDDAYLQLKLNKIVNYQNPISFKCYAVQYNLLRISYGIGGLVFNV
jgi:hypothetical protein